MAKRKKSKVDKRQAVAEALIVWFEGFGYLHDTLEPTPAKWPQFSPLEQMRALKAAEAAIEAAKGYSE